MKKTFWLLPVLLAVPLFAVVPQFWETRTNDDFRDGKFSNLSLTSDDELVLAPRFDLVFNTDPMTPGADARIDRNEIDLAYSSIGS